MKGSCDDFAHRLPRHIYGAPARAATYDEVMVNLRKMQRDVVIGVYDDDLPPRPFDPAQSESA